MSNRPNPHRRRRRRFTDGPPPPGHPDHYHQTRERLDDTDAVVVVGIQVAAGVADLPTGPAGETRPEPAYIFGFTTLNGDRLPPLVLPMSDTEADHVADIIFKAAQDIKGLRGSTVEETAPTHACWPTAALRGECRGCGVRIFGDLVERGWCLACDPGEEAV